MVATHAVLVLEVAYYRFDGGPTSEGALDGEDRPRFWPAKKTLKVLSFEAFARDIRLR